jgi:Skp family chaperone for outer membrane proteins
MENCEHAKAFIEDSKAEAKSLQSQIEPMLKDFEALKKKLAALPEQKRDAYKDEYEKQERAIQDFEKKGRESIKKKSDQQIKILYKEIEDAVIRLAKYRQIDLVMHYNDFVDEMKDQPANIRNKFINATLFPMYSAPGIDITKDILTMLNQRSAAATKPPAGQ